MDPQKNTLDPKLKEAYDSVMGFKIPNAPQPAVVAPPPSPQKPVVSPTTWPASGPQITNQSPSIPPQEPVVSPISWSASDPQPISKPPPPTLLPHEPVVSPSASQSSGPQIISQPPTSFPQPSSIQHSPLPVPKIVTYHSSDKNTQHNKQAQGKKWRLRWVLIFFLIAAFLLGYAIFWIKVFGIKLPFLSNFL